MSDVVGSKSRVAVVTGSDMEAAVRAALDLIGGIEQVVRPGDTVFIKPNFCVSIPPETGVITDPGIIDILIPIVQASGPAKLMVGDSTVVGFDTSQVFKELNLVGRFERLGATLINLDQDEVVEVAVPDGAVLDKIKVFRTPYESDVIISVPTMKTHILTGVTLGLKNMKGILPDEMKKTMHRVGAKRKVQDYELEHAIADLNSVRRPNLTVIDGFTANEGYEPGTPGIGGTPVEFNTVVAGVDPVSVDAVASYLMGFDPDEIKHIVYARNRKIGIGVLDQIQVLGTSPEDLRREFKRPSLQGIVFDFKDVVMIAGEGCSGCREAALIGLSALTEPELEEIGKAAVILGTGVGPSEQTVGKRLFLVGNCTFKSPLEGVRVEGCPPPGVYVKQCLLGG